MRIRSPARPACLITIVALLALPAFAPAQALDWTIVRGEVRIVCPLTVGGSFEGRSQAISGTLTLSPSRPPSFRGEVRLGLKTIDTGIDLRNRHLRENYLEVARGAGFDNAILEDLVLQDADPDHPGGKTHFSGQLTVHGVRNPVSGTADIRVSAQTALVEARFPLLIADHQIPPPRYLGVGVRDEIQVFVSVTLKAKAQKE